MAMLSGELVQWQDERGFGFVEGSDGKRYFVHISDIGRIANRPRPGDAVSFSPVQGRDGRPAAKAVTILGANPRTGREAMQRGLPAQAPRIDWRLPLLLLLAGSTGMAVGLDRLPWEVALAYAAFGSLSFLLYRLDKGFAEAGHWRISEAMLLAVDLCFGIMGGLLGQALFRHKTRKPGYIATTLLISAVHLLWLGGLAFGLIHREDLLGLVSWML